MEPPGSRSEGIAWCVTEITRGNNTKNKLEVAAKLSVSYFSDMRL